uniref:Protein kinase domain-containing protein n=1 Tax=Strongyloides papillosus TaxID=174720 RepID=A0A0N5BT75_STREA
MTDKDTNVNEVVPDFNIDGECCIEEPENDEIYFIKSLLKVGRINLCYSGIRKKTNKEICIKPLSVNGHLMIREILNFFKSEPEKCKVFLPIIDIVIADSIRTNFVVLEGTFINLAETFNIKDKEIVDLQHIFLKHSLRATKFLHQNGFIHGNLSITSFWVKFNSEKEAKCIFHHKYIGEILLADLEYCIKIKDNGDNSKIKKISQQRITSKPKSYKYCALGLHKGEKMCMKFDFESIYYILVQLYEKKLPWDKFSDDERLIRKEKQKMRSPTYDFYRNIPEHIAEIVCFIDKKSPDKVPDTEDIKKRFYHYLKKKTFYDEDNYILGDSDYTRTAEYYRLIRKRREESNEPFSKSIYEEIIGEGKKQKKNSPDK